MKTGKRILSIFLAVLMVVLSAPAASLVGVMDWLGGLELFPKAHAADTSGSCGKNLTWSFNEETRVLTIEGTGAMDGYSISDYSHNYDDYYVTTAPWRNIHTEINSVVISDGVTNIGSDAFYNCRVYRITISETVTTIGQYAFCKCNFSNVTIPDSITNINNGAFNSCNSLRNVIIGSRVESIVSAFSGCPNLESFTVSADNMYYCSFDNMLFNKDKTELILCPRKKNEASIPNSVEIICDSAFRECASITEITIPDRVRSVGEKAFYQCGSLESVTIGDSVKSIGKAAFYHCERLGSILIPDSVILLDSSSSIFGALDGVFSGCSSLKSVVIGSGLTKINAYSFYGCSALDNVVISDGVSGIDKFVFYKCTALKKVLIPDTVINISSNAFKDCPNLTICGNAGSYAEIYANENGIPFERVDVVGNGDGELSVNFSSYGETHPFCGLIVKAVSLDGNKTYSGFVTSNEMTFMSGLDETKQYKLELLSDNGTVFGTIDNVTFDENNQATVAFENLLPRKSVALKVQDAGGNTLTDGFSVQWYWTDSNKFIGSGSNVKNVTTGVNLSYDITLSEELQKTYVVPERQNLTVGDDGEVTFRLTEIPTGTLAGTVKDASGAPVMNAAVSVVQQINSKVSQNAATKTDKDGAFFADVLAIPVTVSVSKSGYRPFTWSGSAADLPEIVLQELTGERFSLSITKKEAGAEEATNEYSFANIDFTVSVNGTAVPDVVVQDFALILPVDAIAESDTLRVTAHDRSGDYADATAELTYAVDGGNTIALNFVQKGHVDVTAAASANNSNMLLLFEADGAFVRAVSMPGVYASSGTLEAGTYTAVVAGESDMLRNVPRLALLDEYGLDNGKDYYAAFVSVADGEVAELTGFDVPKLDETKLYYTDPEKTSLRTTASFAALGQRLLLRAEYAFDAETAQNVTSPSLSIALPEGCNVVLGSVTLNGYETADYSVRDQVLTIPTGTESGVVRLYVYSTVINVAVPLSFAASLSFDLNGEAVRQPIGSLQVKAKEMEFSVPTKTARTTNTVTGKTIPDAAVELYDNDVLVGTATANKAGRFSFTFDLVEPKSYSVHEIYVKVATGDGGTITSQTEKLIFDENFIEASKLKMIYGSYTIVVDYQNPAPSSASKYYSFVPSKPTFSFVAEFTRNDPDMIHDVYAVTTDAKGVYT